MFFSLLVCMFKCEFGVVGLYSGVFVFWCLGFIWRFNDMFVSMFLCVFYWVKLLKDRWLIRFVNFFVLLILYVGEYVWIFLFIFVVSFVF